MRRPRDRPHAGCTGKRDARMDSAREKRSCHIVEAESLWGLELVDVHGYECHGCGIPVYPASYERDSNKKRPYFSRRKQVHASDCEIDGRPALVQRAKTGRIGRAEGFPVPFPSRLVLEDQRPTEQASDNQELDPAARGRTRTRSGNGSGTGRYHGHTVTTIRPMCRTFIDFPHDRAYLPASIPGCAGTTYAGLFHRLHSVRSFQPPIQLYYAPMRWSRPVTTNELCRVAAGRGRLGPRKEPPSRERLPRTRTMGCMDPASARHCAIRDGGLQGRGQRDNAEGLALLRRYAMPGRPDPDHRGRSPAYLRPRGGCAGLSHLCALVGLRAAAD